MVVRNRAASTATKFRIMLVRANGQTSMVFMTPELAVARSRARRLVKKHLAKLNANWQTIRKDAARPRILFIEAWRGSDCDGHWETLGRHNGGFKFEFYDRRRGQKDQKLNADTTPGSTVVPCILDRNRTRKGGWRARTADGKIIGPITNWQDVPTEMKEGDSIDLRIESCSWEHARGQFRWVG